MTARRASRPVPFEAEWRTAADRIGGRYELGRRRRWGKIVVPADPWTIELSPELVQVGTAQTTVTRSRAFTAGRGDFRFSVQPRGRLGRLISWMGLGVELHDQRLDRAIMARSRHPDRVRPMLRDPAVWGPVSTHRLRVRFQRAGWRERRRLGRATRVVLVEADGVVSDPDRLASMVELTRTVLARLASVGVVDSGSAPDG